MICRAMNTGVFLRRHAAALWLAAGVSIFHTLTMPARFYSGDNFAPRLEAADWLNTGSLGIAYDYRPRLAGFLEQRGQYFYENDTRQQFFSKYGFGHTLLYALPYAAINALGEPVGADYVMSGARPQLVAINLFQVALSALIALYFYAMAALYDRSPTRRVLFTLCCFYGTYLWHYLRAPTHEIYQVLPFVGFYVHAILFFRRRQSAEATEAASAWRHALAASAHCAALLTMKLSHGLLLFPFGALALWSGAKDLTPARRALENVRRFLPRYLVYAGIPLALAAGLILATNRFRFESAFHSGYGQWVLANGQAHDRFALEFLPVALPRFLFFGGNANLFVNAPILLFALPGIWPFARKRPAEAAFLGAIFFSHILLISFASFWTGEWCYGPRYLVMIMAIGALPALETMRKASELRGFWPRFLLKGAMGLVMVWSFTIQIHVNSLDYFAYHRVNGLLRQIPDERIAAYVRSRTVFHRGVFCRDLVLYRDRGNPFWPLTRLKTVLPEEQAKIVAQVQAHLDALIEPNFLMGAPPRHPRN